jgi:HD superfamily phosphohydrolase
MHTAVMRSTQRKRTYLDPIHHDIALDRQKPGESLIIDLIDTPEFQRLRRVHQLGVTCFTYQGAESSRFTHSVGAMHVTSKAIDLLGENCSAAQERRQLIMATALLHDLGHGPYSHVTEKILHYDHEDWSCQIITGDTGVNEVLRSHDKDLPAQIASILKHTYKPKFVADLISSQLDCDRFDYLLRDSYMTGTAYGLFALQRILTSLEVDEQEDRIVVSGEKGQLAVEDYLFARYSMYSQVYYHRKNLAARALLGSLIKRAKSLGAEISFMDAETRKWLCGEKLTVQEYLCLDDVQMTYHIKQWVKDKDKILADLAHRFLNRRLFAALKLPGHNHKQVEDIENRAREIVSKTGLDPDYYVSVEKQGIRPYDYYRPDSTHPQTNIMVRTEEGDVKELSSLSQTVEALVRGSFDRWWLIYPNEAKEDLGNLLKSQK